MKMRSSMKLVAASLVLLVMCLAASQATASAIYYRMENDGTSEDNSPTVDLTLAAGGAFSSDVPGSIIVDGANQYANTASYDHSSALPSTTTDYMVSRAAVDSAAGFTVECFVKVDEGATAAQLLKWDFAIVGESWYLEFNASQIPTFGARTPVYPNEYGEGAWGEVISNGGTISEGEWHHIAAVGTVVDDYPNSWTLYESVTLYVDYQPVGTRFYYSQAGQTPQFPRFQWTDDNVRVAYNAFNNGLLDEIRLSDVALAPDDFLHAIPEPTTVALLGLGAFGLLRKKR